MLFAHGTNAGRRRTVSLNLSQVSDATSLNSTVNVNTSQYRTLYPPSEPFRNGTIQVDTLHTIYYEEHGLNPADLSEGSEPVNGIPIAHTALFLHGGPGAGCSPNHARFFDPTRYRIVLLDQRGSGRSTPRGEVRNNTLNHLVADCESLRKTLGIKRWDVVLGGSWGTTLAIAYAQSFPQSVGSLVLRGICTMRPIEIDWLFSSRGGAATLNPQGWTEFEEAVGILSNNSTITDGNHDARAALHAHYDRLLGEDNTTRLSAARSWFMWEMRVSSFMNKKNETVGTNETSKNSCPVLAWQRNLGWTCQDLHGNPSSESEMMEMNITSVSAAITKLRKFRGSLNSSAAERETDVIRPVKPVEAEQTNNNSSEAGSLPPQFIPAQSMLTCFYSVNTRHAMNNLDLLSQDRMQGIRGIPCIGVQGGSDLICPPDTALDLLELWPDMELRIPITAGHSMYDPAITHELVKATDKMANQTLEEL